MKIGILGYGKEGQSAESYFKAKGDEIKIFDNFTKDELDSLDLSSFDLVLRSPSVPPRAHWSSSTKYFFEYCPCPIIGVTGTKGKGTTCSMITALLQNLGVKVHLVGNIGTPALDVLDQITPDDAVVYEMSSFQLWDLEKSPHIAVILRIEPDHLNVHTSYDDYVNAKANICKHQTASDTCIYFHDNPDTARIAAQSPAKKLPYPVNSSLVKDTVASLTIPGFYNRENAEAALLAVAAWCDTTVESLIAKHANVIRQTLHDFQGLPHRLQFLRELNGVKYYDDNFSTTPTSLEVALKSFPDQSIILIAGGRDKTNGQAFPQIAGMIRQAHVAKTIFIGESGRELHQLLPDSVLAEDLPSAVRLAKDTAEALANSVVLMSPSAASFDMFKNVYDRGAQFQKIIQDL